ncbi:hypothetical protein QNH46_05255 [Paenibacillus woosongensis]|uniref:Uncharacterized protein n=1 Tax=Paenibacillus woosongensis TaxID=307580 RepID=A0AA95IC58_9BACL|nr:hypothetical protein [Paenibacillus woosongensis]WHX50075.1 hypothetical protein QNH46_05255 [Paenibacillus woosongensis]
MSRIVEYNHILPSKYGIIPLIYRQSLLRIKGENANKVLEEYENKYDFMYLFANNTVLDFYPKFGFKAVEEHLFSMDFTPSQFEHTGIRKLNVSQADDFRFIYKFASERMPVSQRFGTDYTQGILMYYCLNVFCNDIYYLEKENAIAIYKKENNHMDIFDIINIKEVKIQDILTTIAGRDTTINPYLFKALTVNFASYSHISDSEHHASLYEA